MVQKGQVTSGVADSKATDSLIASTASKQADKVMSDYVWTGCEEFRSDDQLTVTFDMSYCGREDTMAIAVYSHCIDRCNWLPPQAPLGISNGCRTNDKKLLGIL